MIVICLGPHIRFHRLSSLPGTTRLSSYSSAHACSTTLCAPLHVVRVVSQLCLHPTPALPTNRSPPSPPFVSAQPDACSCYQPANISAALYKHPPTGDCPPHGSARVASTHANMSKRSRLTMDTFSPMHQPDEGYSEDPLNPMTNYDITSIPASLKTPGDLPDWLLSNSSNLPTHLKKGMSCWEP